MTQTTDKEIFTRPRLQGRAKVVKINVDQGQEIYAGVTGFLIAFSAWRSQ